MAKINGKSVLNALNGVFEWADRRGLMPPMPTFLQDYTDYPDLKRLEDAWPEINAECVRMLADRSAVTDIKDLGGNYTAGGIHVIKWKSFVLYAGEVLEQNAKICPKTAEVLSGIPGIYLAFFSILEPEQYITPHWGYYKGLLRYHLGVVIPNNNANHECWLRINTDKADNESREHSAVERGEKYYWHNGKGVFFDDTRLHDAANESKEVRVVLWVDVRRKMPWFLDVLNRGLLALVVRSTFLAKLRNNANVDTSKFTSWAG
jgi:beta-hydroxylase